MTGDSQSADKQTDICCLKRTSSWAFPQVRMSELHSFSRELMHLRGWASCTFSFVSELLVNNSESSCPDLHFEALLSDIVDRDREEMLLCPVRSLEQYLTWTESCCSDCSHLFYLHRLSEGNLSGNTIAFLDQTHH